MDYPILIVKGIKYMPLIDETNNIVYYNISSYRVFISSLTPSSSELIVMDECFAVEIYVVENIVEFLESIL